MIPHPGTLNGLLATSMMFILSPGTSNILYLHYLISIFFPPLQLISSQWDDVLRPHTYSAPHQKFSLDFAPNCWFLIEPGFMMMITKSWFPISYPPSTSISKFYCEIHHFSPFTYWFIAIFIISMYRDSYLSIVHYSTSLFWCSNYFRLGQWELLQVTLVSLWHASIIFLALFYFLVHLDPLLWN